MGSAVDRRFGRAKYGVVVDLGTNAAKTINDLGVKALITEHVGPKAFAALQAGRVAIYPVADGTVSEAMEELRTGSLTAGAAAGVEGRW